MISDWIAVDWGTSNLRAWAMGPDGVLASGSSDDGMGKLTQAEFEPALLRLIAPWLGAGQTPVIACGMVGARQGWREAPYRQTPCAPVASGALMAVQTDDPRLRMMIAPGLSQSKPADVMRGEETQIAGALALLSNFDGVFCLPGTHSKWAHVSAGEVVSFQTFMTGEMFALLSQHSVLRHGMGGEGEDDAAFAEGLADAMARPEKISARLFTLRAEGLLHGLSPAAARARLSGLLIGLELAAAKPYWLGQRIALIGAAALSTRYADALQAQGAASETLDATACTLAGLAAARGLMQKAMP
ncbi:2-keto-3-deoxy-galactonokinase [Cypionkella aquatica]|uniref:2-keto-3-deoxy-galactonokinase n=1 Tax=Cypionkella aquatica TaxID=1756042 RepID=A0AA37X0Q2_9RHOB|nr:2-dehydro-3-deoxygalactonokinase [Cypionkella aquatica]GLS85985.1 2-keto-3-deoxy-galactonokinase [Cypionkella aquatica]